MHPEELTLHQPAGYAPQIAGWIAGMQDLRQQTLKAVHGLSPAQLEHLPTNFDNSIGSLLYHIAAVEIGWLYVEVLEQEFPAESHRWFTTDRDESGRLLAITGETLEHHLARLDYVRKELLTVFAGMDASDFRRARVLPEYHVTPEWVLYHLLEHEAGHLAQIKMLRKLLP